ncbi:MAG: 1-(5-phosphoribosyl)-5-[(5-phosphoribosylamino)methylideneamino]imidazole-4-carboxamide isomerase [Anaerolineales bacterium]|nr:1-(5-phosphoribosyl)-5-[(5-phosphoribosylamino)methylideneamino]imidazole-4-carboxamide isomerase [Anaerolineales bacterium]
MNEFTIYPAIDLRAGEVVRLKQGRAEEQSTYSNQPGNIAQLWQDAGAQWLHVINLDGAFGENTTKNQAALRSILEVCAGYPKVQFGGGMRDMDSIEQALALGIARVILGTAAIQSPGFARSAIEEFGAGRIAFALDAANGELMTRGWQEKSGVNLLAFAQSLADSGAATLIYTDIQKDGMETGVDWEIAAQLALKTGLETIASGGVAALEDVENTKAAGLDGVIIGRALYEKNFTLEEALRC